MLTPNQRFGPYRLVRRIAVGGMAEVFLAKSEGFAGFEKYCALKVIHPDLASDESFVQMLIEEAKIAVSLSHANIAQVFELGQLEGTYYIAMEYVEGADLFRILQRLGESQSHVPFDIATYIGQQVATGLHYAHTQVDEARRPRSIVHRDISPQNVLLSYAGEVKIVDFGIAKAADSRRETEVGVIKGKYRYMAPEQARGGRVDHRTDIFSTGVILWELLTGRVLYAEERIDELLRLVRDAAVLPPRQLRPEIPPALEQIVLRALARRPEERWSSALELQARLTAFLSAQAPDFTAERAARFVQNTIGSVPEAPARPPRPPTELTSAQPEDVTTVGNDARSLYDDHSFASELGAGAISGDPTLADVTLGLVEAISAPEDELPGHATPPHAPAQARQPTPTLHQVLDFPPYAGPTRGQDLARAGMSAARSRQAEGQDHRLPPERAPAPPLLLGSSAATPGSPRSAGVPYPQASARLAAANRPGVAALPDVPRERRGSAMHPLDRALRQQARRPTGAPLANTQQHAAHLQTRGPLFGGTHPADGHPITGDAALPPHLRVRSRRPVARVLLGVLLAASAFAAGWALIDRWDPFPRSLTLEVVSVPPGAAVKIDGRPIGQPTPATVRLPTPKRPLLVELTLPGFRPWSTRTSPRSGEHRHRLVASLVAASGRLTIDSAPQGAEVFIDEVRRGTTPLTLSKLPLNEALRVELRLRGYEAEQRVLRWERTSELRLTVSLHRLE